MRQKAELWLRDFSGAFAWADCAIRSVPEGELAENFVTLNAFHAVSASVPARALHGANVSILAESGGWFFLYCHGGEVAGAACASYGGNYTRG